MNSSIYSSTNNYDKEPAFTYNIKLKNDSTEYEFG